MSILRISSPCCSLGRTARAHGDTYPMQVSFSCSPMTSTPVEQPALLQSSTAYLPSNLAAPLEPSPAQNLSPRAAPHAAQPAMPPLLHQSRVAIHRISGSAAHLARHARQRRM